MSGLEAFRAAVRAFVEARAPRGLYGKAADLLSVYQGGRRQSFASDDHRVWFEVMRERGWVAPTWPVEYGGGGLSPAEGRVLTQELSRLKLPAPLGGMGMSMIGPTLLDHGSDAQKRDHLPRITHGEIRWCQGFSEPNAGSDLASLQCAAVPDGDDFIVNGQKTWTTRADAADWIFFLARTRREGRKQDGISFMLADMTSPGIETRPIELISGSSPFCETFFTDVRVPAANVVGRVDGGWSIAKALLGHERSSLSGGQGGRSSNSARIVELAKACLGENAGCVADPVVRDRLTRLLMNQKALKLTNQRAAESAKARGGPGTETSILKLVASEVAQQRHELVLTIRGHRALGWEGEPFTAAELEDTRSWLSGRATTIYGGTSEIQLNIIAKRVLELPD